MGWVNASEGKLRPDCRGNTASEALQFKNTYGAYSYSTSGDISTPYAPETSKKVKKIQTTSDISRKD